MTGNGPAGLRPTDPRSAGKTRPSTSGPSERDNKSGNTGPANPGGARSGATHPREQDAGDAGSGVTQPGEHDDKHRTRRSDRGDLRGGERPARRTQRARDPEARREALAAAAVEVIAENGIGRTTHRAVAAKADLPLGATTYYFPTLDALIAAGLRRAAEAQEADLRLWAERIRSTPDLAAALVALTEEYLADRRQARIEYELCVAAARDDALRPLATAWLDGLQDLLEPRVGGTAARNISALLDGVMLQVLVTGSELDTAGLADAIHRLTRA